MGLTSRRPHGLHPHLFVRDADAAARFYCRALGASELLRNTLDDGTVWFIELALGDGRLLLSEETPSLNALAPPTIGGSPVLLYVEVDDVDGLFEGALAAGAEPEIPVQEMFWGERYGVLRDPFGHRWAISTAREQLTPEDIARRSPPHA
ncbi:MAG TPA: VOC family protein [Candidatus Dormibacteraeota bacterium]|nr:VOC family protein [Candidatus Dormibacteraeota bacterium]